MKHEMKLNNGPFERIKNGTNPNLSYNFPTGFCLKYWISISNDETKASNNQKMKMLKFDKPM